MLLYVLFATRTYEPDSPEAIDVVDDLTDQLNSELRGELEERCRKNLGSDLLRMEWVSIKIDGEEVLQRLNPSKEPITGVLKDA